MFLYVQCFIYINFTNLWIGKLLFIQDAVKSKISKVLIRSQNKTIGMQNNLSLRKHENQRAE